MEKFKIWDFLSKRGKFWLFLADFGIFRQFLKYNFNFGTKLIVKDRPKNVLLTTSKFYSQVYSTYRFGCGECTRLGHSHDICQVFKSSANSKGVKRAASLGTSPEAKKMS